MTCLADFSMHLEAFMHQYVHSFALLIIGMLVSLVVVQPSQAQDGKFTAPGAPAVPVR